MQFHGITIDLSRDVLFDEHGLKRMRESYMRADETSPQERFAFVSKAFGSNEAHSQRLYDYSSKHWLSYSTPILSFGRTKKGLPISCFLPYLDDSSAGLVDTFSEVSWLSMMGGGVGIGMGIRSADEKSTGIMPHLKIYDAGSLAYRQGSTRRGSYAAYLDASHPDIIPFIDMRKPTGDEDMRCMNLHHGVNITDDFMQKVEQAMLNKDADISWELKDPHSGEVRETTTVKDIWMRVLETRVRNGEPYMHFIDTSNRALPQHLKDRGLSIKQSNLCSEIYLPTDKQRTAVCCLSSVNLEYFDEWKHDELFLRDIAEMLDNVLQYFIKNAPATIKRAKFSAQRERSIGVGALGFHSYLQSKSIPFESAMAKGINLTVFKHIRGSLDQANLDLGKERGEAPDAEGTGKRFSHVMAIAPNASSSILMGNCSPSIEPYRANTMRQDTMSGSFFLKNKFLDAIIKEACEKDSGLDYQDVWSSINANDGSVQHLKWLSDWDKDVFKTAMEIDQRWIITHAGDRQEFIDQGQSVNVFFRPNAHIKYLHAVHFLAWKAGLKGLYYLRSEGIGKADRVSKKIERVLLDDINLKSMASEDVCLACEG
jgi:ribonucleoside-diphosphate reductase alpha chain